MNLTALDAETEAVIFPFDEGRTRGRCRDEDCRAEMIAVHEVTEVVGEVQSIIRRAHWRHKVAPEGSRRCASQSSKTLWHENWQMTCDDPARIEQRVVAGGQVRVADVMARFGWAIEFQHSSMKSATAKARETHYKGRVLWVVDAVPGTGITGVVDIFKGSLRWSQLHEWVIEAKTLMAVDDGLNVHILPPGGLRRYLTAGELLVPIQHVLTYSREAFVEQWVNGERLPLEHEPNTEWAQMRALKARKSRDREASDARLAANSARRAEYDPAADICSYAGNRAKLVYADDAPIKTVTIGTFVTHVHMCRREGCISAAGPSGWCWSHGVANDIGFDPRLGITA